MKNVKFAAAVMGLVFVGIFGFVKVVDFAYDKVRTPGMTKAQAESRTGVMLRQPTVCSGEYDGWQCRGMHDDYWVSCIGDNCYRIK